MRVCQLTPPIPNPADVIDSYYCSHQMPAVGGHSQLVMWNLIVVSILSLQYLCKRKLRHLFLDCRRQQRFRGQSVLQKATSLYDF